MFITLAVLFLRKEISYFSFHQIFLCIFYALHYFFCEEKEKRRKDNTKNVFLILNNQEICTDKTFLVISRKILSNKVKKERISD